MQDVEIFSTDPLARPENLLDGNICAHDEERSVVKPGTQPDSSKYAAVVIQNLPIESIVIAIELYKT